MAIAEEALPAKKIGDRILYRIFICIVTLALLASMILFGAIAIVCYGPSPAARDLYVIKMTECGAPAYFVSVFLSEDTIREILDADR